MKSYNHNAKIMKIEWIHPYVLLVLYLRTHNLQQSNCVGSRARDGSASLSPVRSVLPGPWERYYLRRYPLCYICMLHHLPRILILVLAPLKIWFHFPCIRYFKRSTLSLIFVLLEFEFDWRDVMLKLRFYYYRQFIQESKRIHFKWCTNKFNYFDTVQRFHGQKLKK